MPTGARVALLASFVFAASVGADLARCFDTRTRLERLHAELERLRTSITEAEEESLEWCSPPVGYNATPANADRGEASEQLSRDDASLKVLHEGRREVQRRQILMSNPARPCLRARLAGTPHARALARHLGALGVDLDGTLLITWRGLSGDDGLGALGADLDGTLLITWRGLSGDDGEGYCEELQLDVSLETGFSVRACGLYATGQESYKGLLAHHVTGQIVIAEPTFGCNTLVNAKAVAGNVVVIDRGSCTFEMKAGNAYKAGAAAIIIADDRFEGHIKLSGDFSAIPVPVTAVTLSSGLKIKGLAGASARVRIGTMFQRDKPTQSMAVMDRVPSVPSSESFAVSRIPYAEGRTAPRVVLSYALHTCVCRPQVWNRSAPTRICKC